ncbi:MAG TPA: enoyl-CoA hydratase [Xanthobacteraceae bacterium]|nr:enoyl-CoA hydratase [Xanthobacteraceae bacterium]
MEDAALALRLVPREGGAVAYVTVSNPKRLNVLDTPLMTAFVAVIETLGVSDALRAVVLSGEGDKAFIGGIDIREMASLDPLAARALITLVHRTCDGLRKLPVPVIARIDGYALGGGLEIAAACDMRVASTRARFGMPEVKVGIPSVVEAALLPQLIGWGHTRELLLCGDMIDAATAERWGLVEEVVAPEALDAAVERRVAALLAAGPRAVRLQKALIRTWEGLSPAEAVAAGIDCFVDAWTTDEPARRMSAFLERRRPRK